MLLFLQGSYIISDGYFTVLLRPEDRVNKLSEQLANTEGKIGDLKILLITQPCQPYLTSKFFWLCYKNSLHTAMSTMLVLFYLFCDGKTEDNLSQMFNMFDMDGNKVRLI